MAGSMMLIVIILFMLIPSILLSSLVTPAGLEPATCALEARCSVHLSYGIVDLTTKALGSISRSTLGSRPIWHRVRSRPLFTCLSVTNPLVGTAARHRG